MKLIFIYGPPAAGKTTIGGELAKLTGYRFFYNHLTVPAAKAIFPDSNNLHQEEGYAKLLRRLRLDALEAAAEAGLDVIFTVAYSGIIDDDFVAHVVQIFETRGGSVYFVELHAPEEVLLRRVTDPARAALHLGKMTDPEHLRRTLAARDVYASVAYSNILKIDTSKLQPVAAAARIAERILAS